MSIETRKRCDWGSCTVTVDPAGPAAQTLVVVQVGAREFDVCKIHLESLAGKEGRPASRPSCACSFQGQLLQNQFGR